MDSGVRGDAERVLECSKLGRGVACSTTGTAYATGVEISSGFGRDR